MMPASQTTNQTELDFLHPVGAKGLPESHGAENLWVGTKAPRRLELWLLAYRGPEPGSPYGAERPEYYRGMPF